MEKMENIVKMLNEASEAYYSNNDELMSNAEWDALFDQLKKLEEETGVVLPDSPTKQVGYSRAQSGDVEHEFPALSLAKTKDVAELEKWAGDRPVWISWKLDGLTVVATYDNGELSRIVTRGDGHKGKDITHLAPYIKNLPLKITDTNHLVVRGECLISNEDFEKINAENGQIYANARNLASGTLALDKSRAAEAAERCVAYVVFTPVKVDTATDSWGDKMDYLQSIGFCTVEHMLCSAASVNDIVKCFTELVSTGKAKYPVDGLVICYDDTAYASTGSVTGHHATRAGLAFKWADKPAKTTLRNIEWSVAAQSICPVAVFDPVELEGTTVSRASLSNISEIKRLKIGENGKTTLEVIKANMIIPKVVKVLSSEGSFSIPSECPVCGGTTKIVVSENGTETLLCTNLECSGKKIRIFERFCSKEGMDIDGLSAKSISDLVNSGFIHDFSDFYHLGKYRDEIANMPGWGKKSAENLLSAVEKSKINCDPVHFVKALAIPMIGRDFMKKILEEMTFDEFTSSLSSRNFFFSNIHGIGEAKTQALQNWFSIPKNEKLFFTLLSLISFDEKRLGGKKEGGRCSGLTFVITGSVHHFSNRDAFKAFVEENGGKVSGSVSAKTSFLVNNDTTSTSGKNKKAAELGIPVISEDEFLNRFA